MYRPICTLYYIVLYKQIDTKKQSPFLGYRQVINTRYRYLRCIDSRTTGILRCIHSRNTGLQPLHIFKPLQEFFKPCVLINQCCFFYAQIIFSVDLHSFMHYMLEGFISSDFFLNLAKTLILSCEFLNSKRNFIYPKA